MQKNNEWFSKWGICLNTHPINNKEIKGLVMDKFHKRILDYWHYD